LDQLNPKILSVSGPPAGVTSPPVFIDGFGVRYHTVDPESAEPNDPVEVLAFDRSLVDTPEFAETLGVRVARLASVRHTLFARVRRLDRPAENSLLLVSDRVPGWRLASVLDIMERERLKLDISAVLSLLRQLIPTVSLFARHQRELAVGTIGPEHLILTPQGRLVVAEYVLGSALERLPLSREELWRKYRVSATSGAAKIWPRSDALSIGVVVLSLLYGRRLRDDEFPDSLSDLLEDAEETSGGIVRPLSPKFSGWLGRALQVDTRTGFQSPQEAQIAFEEMLASERSYVTTPALLETFIARFIELTERKPAGRQPEPPAAPPTPPAAPATPAAIRVTPPAPVVGDDEPDTFAIEQAVASIATRPQSAPPLSPPSPPSSPSSSPPPTRPPFSFEDVVPEPAPPAADASPRARIERALGGSTRLFAALAVALLIAVATIVWLWTDSPETLVGSGELVVQSRPPGATVTLDDKSLGVTPVTVRLSPGIYTLKVQLGTAEPRVIAVQIRAGVQTVQYLELQNAR
jgi:hypothetical protein